MMKILPHKWGNDAECIHCGLDGADIPRPYKENTPPCPVQDPDVRAKNERGYTSEWDAEDGYRRDEQAWDEYDAMFGVNDV